VRVRERDFFSRYALFIEDGNVNIADTTSYYGPVHVNKNITFMDSVDGVGAQVHGFMSSCNKFTFNGDAEAETVFYEGYADGLGLDGWIDLPDPKAIESYRDDTGAFGAGGSSLWKDGARELRKGPGGFAVTGNVYTYIELIYDKATDTQYVKFTIRDTSGGLLFTSSLTSDYEMPDPAVIHVQKSIHGLKGELNTAATIVAGTKSDNSDICLTADIYYVDDEGDHPRIFDPDHPENENYLPNPNYNGDAVLGIIAKQDVLYTGAEDDKNLEVNGAIMAITGQVKWGGGSTDKDHLRVFGARISSGRTYRASWGGGYNNSGVYVYDDRLRCAPPPKFLTVDKPMYIGFEVVR